MRIDCKSPEESLFSAIEKNDLLACQKIVMKDKSLAVIRDPLKKITPLVYAIQSGKIEIALWLYVKMKVPLVVQTWISDAKEANFFCSNVFELITKCLEMNCNTEAFNLVLFVRPYISADEKIKNYWADLLEVISSLIATKNQNIAFQLILAAQRNKSLEQQLPFASIQSQLMLASCFCRDNSTSAVNAFYCLEEVAFRLKTLKINSKDYVWVSEWVEKNYSDIKRWDLILYGVEKILEELQAKNLQPDMELEIQKSRILLDCGVSRKNEVIPSLNKALMFYLREGNFLTHNLLKCFLLLKDFYEKNNKIKLAQFYSAFDGLLQMKPYLKFTEIDSISKNFFDQAIKLIKDFQKAYDVADLRIIIEIYKYLKKWSHAPLPSSRMVSPVLRFLQTRECNEALKELENALKEKIKPLDALYSDIELQEFKFEGAEDRFAKMNSRLSEIDDLISSQEMQVDALGDISSIGVKLIIAGTEPIPSGVGLPSLRGDAVSVPGTISSSVGNTKSASASTPNVNRNGIFVPMMPPSFLRGLPIARPVVPKHAKPKPTSLLVMMDLSDDKETKLHLSLPDEDLLYPDSSIDDFANYIVSKYYLSPECDQVSAFLSVYHVQVLAKSYSTFKNRDMPPNEMKWVQIAILYEKSLILNWQKYLKQDLEKFDFDEELIILIFEMISNNSQIIADAKNLDFKSLYGSDVDKEQIDYQKLRMFQIYKEFSPEFINKYKSKMNNYDEIFRLIHKMILMDNFNSMNIHGPFDSEKIILDREWLNKLETKIIPPKDGLNRVVQSAWDTLVKHLTDLSNSQAEARFTDCFKTRGALIRRVEVKSEFERLEQNDVSMEEVSVLSKDGVSGFVTLKDEKKSDKTLSQPTLSPATYILLERFINTFPSKLNGLSDEAGLIFDPLLVKTDHCYKINVGTNAIAHADYTLERTPMMRIKNLHNLSALKDKLEWTHRARCGTAIDNYYRRYGRQLVYHNEVLIYLNSEIVKKSCIGIDIGSTQNSARNAINIALRFLKWGVHVPFIFYYPCTGTANIIPFSTVIDQAGISAQSTPIDSQKILLESLTEKNISHPSSLAVKPDFSQIDIKSITDIKCLVPLDEASEHRPLRFEFKMPQVSNPVHYYVRDGYPVFEIVQWPAPLIIYDVNSIGREIALKYMHQQAEECNKIQKKLDPFLMPIFFSTTISFKILPNERHKYYLSILIVAKDPERQSILRYLGIGDDLQLKICKEGDYKATDDGRNGYVLRIRQPQQVDKILKMLKFMDHIVTSRVGSLVMELGLKNTICHPLFNLAKYSMEDKSDVIMKRLFASFEDYVLTSRGFVHGLLYYARDKITIPLLKKSKISPNLISEIVSFLLENNNFDDDYLSVQILREFSQEEIDINWRSLRFDLTILESIVERKNEEKNLVLCGKICDRGAKIIDNENRQSKKPSALSRALISKQFRMVDVMLTHCHSQISEERWITILSELINNKVDLTKMSFINHMPNEFKQFVYAYTKLIALEQREHKLASTLLNKKDSVKAFEITEKSLRDIEISMMDRMDQLKQSIDRCQKVVNDINAADRYMSKDAKECSQGKSKRKFSQLDDSLSLEYGLQDRLMNLDEEDDFHFLDSNTSADLFIGSLYDANSMLLSSGSGSTSHNDSDAQAFSMVPTFESASAGILSSGSCSSIQISPMDTSSTDSSKSTATASSSSQSLSIGMSVGGTSVGSPIVTSLASNSAGIFANISSPSSQSALMDTSSASSAQSSSTAESDISASKRQRRS